MCIELQALRVRVKEGKRLHHFFFGPFYKFIGNVVKQTIYIFAAKVEIISPFLELAIFLKLLSVLKFHIPIETDVAFLSAFFNQNKGMRPSVPCGLFPSSTLFLLNCSYWLIYSKKFVPEAYLDFTNTLLLSLL